MHDESQKNDDTVADPHVSCVAQLTECEGKWKRALADLANETKANARAREEFVKYATANFIRDVLPIVDAVEAAMGTTHPTYPPLPTGGEGQNRSSASRREGELEGVGNGTGFDAIAKLLHNLLTHHGVTRILCAGTPNYTLHEIIGTREAEGVELGAIVEEVQHGYTMHGQCLRPAKVIVAEEKKAPHPADAG